MTSEMTSEYYDIFYCNGESERVWRFEDMLACRFGSKKVKRIIRYREFVGIPTSSFKVEVIYETNTIENI